MSIQTTYSSLNTELKSSEIGINPAELHGFITGIIVGGIQDESWQTLLNDMMNDGQPITGKLLQSIQQLHEQIIQKLNNENFEFQLLLNEKDLFTQIDDMVGWVNHFLLGLGLAQPQLAKVKGDVGEAIYDLRQITQLGYDEEDDQDELAFALEEILEYVRMSVILCYDEFNDHPTSKTLH